RADEVVFPPLYLQVTDGNHRQTAPQLRPTFPAVHRHKKTELGAREQHVLVDGVLGKAPDAIAARQRPRQGHPRLAAIGGFKHVRLEVATLPIIECRVDRVRVMPRGTKSGNVGLLWYAGKDIEFGPILAAVARDLHETIVRSDPKQPFLDR